MSERHVLPGFAEGSIAFEPTYKWKANVAPRVLDNKRGQAPSYCDRVLLASAAAARGMARHVAYYATPGITISDHTPVCACFEIDVN